MEKKNSIVVLYLGKYESSGLTMTDVIFQWLYVFCVITGRLFGGSLWMESMTLLTHYTFYFIPGDKVR